MNKLSRGQIQFQDITPEAWNRMFSVNLGGCFNTIQAVLPDMLSAHEGCIINVSSIWGSHGASCGGFLRGGLFLHQTCYYRSDPLSGS